MNAKGGDGGEVNAKGGDGGEAAAVVWLHGLGDTSPSFWPSWWRSVGLDRVSFHRPIAAVGPVAAHGGASLPRWFDLSSLPVTAAEPEPALGLAEAISTIHRLLDRLVASGVPSRRILLGGFSQGGV